MKDFKVIIYENSSRAADFQKVFGRLDVVVESPVPHLARLPNFDEPQPVYLLDLEALTEEEFTRLVDHITEKFNAERLDVVLQLSEAGMPILASECMVVVHNPGRWVC